MRINHDCQPNAHRFEDSTHGVQVIYAERDIQLGEEITKSYSLKAVGIFTPEKAKLFLKNMGIFCKEDCICRSKNLGKLLEEFTKLNRIVQSALRCKPSHGYDKTLKAAGKLVRDLEAVPTSFICKMSASYLAFEISIMRQSIFEEAKNYLRQAYEIQAALFHPCSSKMIEHKKLFEKQESHKFFALDDE